MCPCGYTTGAFKVAVELENLAPKAPSVANILSLLGYQQFIRRFPQETFSYGPQNMLLLSGITLVQSNLPHTVVHNQRRR